MARTIADFEKGGKRLVGAIPSSPVAPTVPADEAPQWEDAGGNEETAARAGTPRIREISVELVSKAVLQRVTLTGITPDKVGDYFRTFDPDMKFRDEFPAKFSRETKLGTCYQVVVNPGRGIVDLSVRTDGDPINVSVTRNKLDMLLPALRAIGKLSEEKMSKLERSWSDKKQGNSGVLPTDQEFGVKYWTGSDGGFMWDSFQVEGLPEPAKA